MEPKEWKLFAHETPDDCSVIWLAIFRWQMWTTLPDPHFVRQDMNGLYLIDGPNAFRKIQENDDLQTAWLPYDSAYHGRPPSCPLDQPMKTNNRRPTASAGLAIAEDSSSDRK